MDQLAIWRDISIVFLAVQCLVGVVLLLALTYVLVRLMNMLQGKVETGLPMVQRLTNRVASRTQVYANKATAPILAAQRMASRSRTTAAGLIPRRMRAKATTTPTPPPGMMQQ